MPREIVEVRAIEATDTVAPSAGRFPKTTTVLELAELADACRVAASAIEATASNASFYDAGTLRRNANAIVRALVGQLGARVVLVLACLAAVACGGAAEPPVPLDCKAVDLAGYCSDTRCVSVLECNRAPTQDDYPDATCKAVDEGRLARADLAAIVGRLRYTAFEVISLAAEKMGAPALASRSSRPPGASPFPRVEPVPASARTKAG